MNYRKKEDVNIIRFPSGFEEENRGRKDCCPEFLALADVADDENYKNDIRGIAIKISDVSDIVTFVIEKCGVSGVLPNLGESAIFPEDDLAVGFMYNWREYLDVYGPGKYTISIEFTISNVTGGYTEGKYNLMPYSIATAKSTVRSWSEFNSFALRKNIDFTNSNFKDSLRFKGYFGDKQHKTQVNSLLTTGFSVEKTKHTNDNEYTLTTYPVGIFVTRRLFDEHFLLADKILMSDHNSSNHDYIIFDKGVSLNEEPETTYYKGNRFATVVAKFGDRVKDDISYYNRT